MRSLAMAAVLLGLAPAPIAAAQASAAPADSGCALVAADLDERLKQDGYLEAQDLMPDESAARATMRAAQRQVQLGIVALDIQQLAANRCAVPRAPLTGRYVRAGLKCATARTDEIKEACDRSKWAPYGPGFTAAGSSAAGSR
jgi:non-ribosomal peptide synthetase component F